MTPAEILREGAKTFEERNAIYKDNYIAYGDVMVLLFPNGVQLKTAEDHVRFQLVLQSVVKMTRYCFNWQTGHADSLRDASVYLAMLEAYDTRLPAPEKPDFEGAGRAEAKPGMCYAVYALNPNGSRQSGFCPKCGYLCASHVANAVEVLARQEVRTTVK